MTSHKPWIVVLAGSKGSRLAPFTVDADGHPAPKQFCRFRGDRSLLSITLERALRLADARRVIVVVVEQQRVWWSRELALAPGVRAISQPRDRGTAVAVLEALTEIRARDPRSPVVIMPSDHDVEDERPLLAAIRRALRAGLEPPRPIVLLGMTPTEEDGSYGWILPAGEDAQAIRPVRAFVEKPAAGVAARLKRAGAVWNSFIVVASTGSLLALYAERSPELLRHCLAARRDPGDDPHPDLYAHLRPLDFSSEVIRGGHEKLRVLAVPPCGWTDLGTPHRLCAWLDRHPSELCALRRHALFGALPAHAALEPV